VIDLPLSLPEILRVVLVAPRIESLRRRKSLHVAIDLARRSGSRAPRRTTSERLALRRSIARVDAMFPGGPNCLRRSLIEICLDRGAADEKLLAGFQRGGGPGSGHAWLTSHKVEKVYDAVFSV
jgi:transglutaminase superfamily protein